MVNKHIPVWIVCLASWIACQVDAVIQIPSLDGIILEKDDASRKIDPAMRKLIDPDASVINPVGKRKYQFNYAKVGDYYLCGTSGAMWQVQNKRNKTVCLFKILIYPSKHEATAAALDGNLNWDSWEPCHEVDTKVERSGKDTFYRYRPQEPTESEMPVHTMVRDGVLFWRIIFWEVDGQILSAKEQKKLLSQVMDVVLSGEVQPSYEEELTRFALIAREEENLREFPDYGMDRDFGAYHRSRRVWSCLPEGDQTFKNPQKMWNRPSRAWFRQFGTESQNDDAKRLWNERGDYVRMDIPGNRKAAGYGCRVYVAHTISEYDALRFMEGFILKGIVYQSREWMQCIRSHRVNRGAVGEYSLSLKPQLDAYGALIPNSEESDISFVRHNTAVRVVADRPDVSVLWIARKIDEELIAAGKGEPPTWTPPAPAKKKGARNVPATSGKPIQRPASKVPAASGG